MGDFKKYLFWFVIPVCVGLFVFKAAYSFRIGNELHPTGNSDSEKVSLIAADNYLKYGYTFAWGLPRHAPDTQTANLLEGIYIHYPPGNEMLLSGAMAICGRDFYACYRMLPLSMSVGSLGVFLVSLTNLLAVPQAIIVGLALLVTPLTTHAMEAFGYEAYAFALLLLQLALLFHITGRQGQVSRWHVWAMAAFGLTQGWISLDFYPLVAFLPLAYSLWPASRISPNHGLMMTLAAGFALTAAFALHFWQVAAYLGSFKKAFIEFVETGQQRCCNTVRPTYYVTQDNIRRLNVIRFQQDVFFPKSTMFGFPAGIFLGLVTLGCLFKAGFKKFGPFDRADLKLLFGFYFLSISFTLLLPQHSFIHYFNTRHYFLVYLAAWIVVGRALQVGARDTSRLWAPEALQNPEPSGNTAH